VSALSDDAGARESYARDASGLRQVPEFVARPSTSDELIASVREAVSLNVPVTMAGAQTSTTGASIAAKGAIVSTRALDRVIDLDVATATVRVQPGVLLGDLNRAIAGEGLFFAPDPTSDQECTVGGSIACNASGPRTLRYGATRPHVRALRVLLADGSVTELRRRAHEKNTVGYAPVQDPVDWFIGSEGTLGVVVEAELALMRRPARETGMAIPFPSARDALAFVVAARESELSPRCLEYFDAEALSIVRTSSPSFSRWALEAGAMVYCECTTDGDDPPFDEWMALAERFSAYGDDMRAFEGDASIGEARRLRHAVPAAMHERAAPFLAGGGRRVSTDWAVPYRRAAEAIERANAHAAALGVIPITYGHLGNGHPHQNFVARDPDDVMNCEKAVEATLRDVMSMDGTVAAEHGVGKIKKKWVPLQLDPMQLGVMAAIKRELDPLGLFAPGNLWP
jgi:FAD/FMN-containing dehydrogenase